MSIESRIHQILVGVDPCDPMLYDHIQTRLVFPLYWGISLGEIQEAVLDARENRWMRKWWRDVRQAS